MIINGTEALCLGSFMRQELGSALKKLSVEGPDSMPDFSVIVDVGYGARAIEVAVVRALTLFCDAETSAHAQRLVALAEATALQLQLATEEISYVRQAALLHDIGKVGVPAAILHKAGPLSEEEWQIMRLHPEIGQQILLHAGGVFEPLAEIVVAHHERWNGEGYPFRLKGEEIPFLARILTVVDAYDAMITNRTYGKLLTVAEACLELQRCAGTQFDPVVVAAFLIMIDRQCAQPMANFLSFYPIAVFNATL